MASLSLLIFLSLLLFASNSTPTQSQKTQLTRRNLVLLDQELEEAQPLPKPTTTKKKIPISTLDSKNQTKPIKPKKSNSTSTSLPTLTSTTKSKLNKTLTLKPANSTKLAKSVLKPANSTKLAKSLLKPTNSTKLAKSPLKTSNSTKPIKPMKLTSANPAPKPAKKTKPVNPDPIWLDETDSDLDPDLLAEFRDLPAQIHDALIPDLRKISITSKAYIFKAHKNIAENVRPFVGNKFAPKIALAASCIFLIVPLCLLTFLICQLNSYLSLQRFLIFVQAYLAIYFLTLSLTAVVTGLEPLKFFYATSPASYAWTQAVQTLGYLLYLLVQLIHLVVVFSGGESKRPVTRALALAQMMVGLAVGCHYYAAVFHRAVTGDQPRANWKVHGVYAGCFLVILMLARAERGKKAYDGGEDGKKN